MPDTSISPGARDHARSLRRRTHVSQHVLGHRRQGKKDLAHLARRAWPAQPVVASRRLRPPDTWRYHVAGDTWRRFATSSIVMVRCVSSARAACFSASERAGGPAAGAPACAGRREAGAGPLPEHGAHIPPMRQRDGALLGCQGLRLLPCPRSATYLTGCKFLSVSMLGTFPIREGQDGRP